MILSQPIRDHSIHWSPDSSHARIIIQNNLELLTPNRKRHRSPSVPAVHESEIKSPSHILFFSDKTRHKYHETD
ncbi:hypothetical protein VTJ04DRAFT_3927 [Mycothermus thermophilus]|uniref:uncharacterized protein n=1 Tax=Humicola insolens TaxID=85995 RepID=UPI003744AD3D